MILVAAVVAVTVSGCDDDTLKPEEAGPDELTQEFDNICSVRMVFETYNSRLWWSPITPEPIDFSPYAALESDMNGLFSIYVKNESDSTIMIEREDYFVDDDLMTRVSIGISDLDEYYDFPAYLLNFLGIFNEDGSYRKSLLADGSSDRFRKRDFLAPGEEVLYFRNDMTDYFVGEPWGIGPGKYDVKLKFQLPVWIYDGVYEETDDGSSLVDSVEPSEYWVLPVDMTMRMVCVPAPERKPVNSSN